MIDVTVTVWTVMQGDEDGAYLVDLNINRDRAKAAFDEVLQGIDGAVLQQDENDGLSARTACDWVKLEPRVMPVPLGDLLSLLRKPAVDLADRLANSEGGQP